MPEATKNGNGGGAAGMIMQLTGILLDAWRRVEPVLAQPITRIPYNLPLATSQVVAAGANNVILTAADFQHNLEWPFEVGAIKFSQDPAHTFRDWRVFLRENVFSQNLMNAAAMVATLVQDNTGMWRLDFPLTIRAKGGGVQIAVTNLDAVNPITVDINLQGYLLIPTK